jgi:hypothetical protein
VIHDDLKPPSIMNTVMLADDNPKKWNSDNTKQWKETAMPKIVKMLDRFVKILCVEGEGGRGSMCWTDDSVLFVRPVVRKYVLA